MQSFAPEDGRNHRPKHVELIGIINKLLLLYLVGCLYYLCKSYITQGHKGFLCLPSTILDNSLKFDVNTYEVFSFYPIHFVCLQQTLLTMGRKNAL